ncbi:hypothetical protein GCM10023185_09740 [Hymenobacter saemangeumensis]|uniref:T9SS type A sorting domain-containing protein n=2 Tax=Hymenobacter saemangeumensis TaxID=1084522 RepID=A0ABP8I538_9BACT
MTEMIVVPVPGVCREYYLIYTLGGPNGGAVCYARIQCPVGSAPVIATNSTILDLTYRSRTLIAVSKPRPNGSRILYDVSDVGIRSFTINMGGGFSALPSVPIPGVAGVMDAQWELDLAPDGSKLAWTMSGPVNKLFVATIDAAGSPGTIAEYSASGALGVEFSGNSQKLFVSAPGSIRVLDYAMAVPALATVVGGADASETQMELAYDGLIYYVNTSGRLKTINPCDLIIATSPVTTTLDKTAKFWGSMYLLPDQLDGENYQYVPNTAAPYVNSARIDNQFFTMGTTRNLYTCNPLALQASLLGVEEVRLSLYASNSAGAVGALICAEPWVRALPATVKTACSSYLANPANAGQYYVVKLEGRSVCGTVVQQSGRYFLNSLVPASVSLQFNPCTGMGILASSTSAAQPAEVGMYGGGIDVAFGAGTYTNYQVDFEEYLPASGTYVARGLTVYGTNTSGTNPTTIALSLLANQADLGTGYFAPGGGGNNKIFRITVTVSNQCGAVTLQGHFRPSNPNCRPAPGPTGSSVSVYPNPLQRGPGQFTFTLPTTQRVSLAIVDALTGCERLVLLQNSAYSAGTHTLKFDGSSLPQGVYIYRFVADTDTQTGRILQAR